MSDTDRLRQAATALDNRVAQWARVRARDYSTNKVLSEWEAQAALLRAVVRTTDSYRLDLGITEIQDAARALADVILGDTDDS